VRRVKGKSLTAVDREELRKFRRFLLRRNDRPDEPLHMAYAEVYVEVVFEDKEDKET
jgi:hypothetical protein